MLYFENDYCEGAHPAILQKLTETNFEKVSGYGTDPYCASAREKIRAACACPEADVQFISGGTQSNAIVIASMLQRWQGVVAAATGHVAGHEAGAIEYTGHKVITLPQHNGKLDAAELRALVATFYADDNHDHMVFPGMVYISHPTEYGTLYTKAELEALHAVCQEYKMPLFLDGARLGYGLAAEGTDVTLADLARLTDVFYIGGTKVGALCGEAVVFPHGAPAHFMTMVKQQGALLAKGRLLGIQFDVLFTDGLYFSISKNAIATANRLKAGFAAKGYRFFMDSPTNQIFLVLENTQLAALEGKAKFGFWEKFDDTHTVVRIATSWATRMDEVEALIDLMRYNPYKSRGSEAPTGAPEPFLSFFCIPRLRSAFQRLTGGIALGVVRKDIHNVVQRLGQAEAAGNVGRDDHVRLCPQRMLRRQRLGVGHVQPCTGKPPAVHSRCQRLAVHGSAAPHIE